MREGWKQVTIGDLGQVITGNTPPRKQPELYGNHTLFVKPTDMEVDKKYCYNPEEKYSEKGFIKYKKSIIPKGSTCVVTIGSIGQKMIKAHKELFINQAVNAVVPNNLYDEDFVYYLLKLNLFQLKTFDSGTASGRENVSKSSFSNIKLVVPASKEKQHKIGSILSTYDDLIENNLKRIKLLEEKSQLTYEEWFVKMRFPGYETAKFDEVTGLPEGWDRKNFGELTEAMQYGYTESASNEPIGPKFLRITDIVGFNINWENVPYCPISDKEKSKYLLKEGDIVIARTGATVGYAKRINKNCPEAVFASYLIRLKLKPEIDDVMMGVFVESNSFVKTVQSMAGGAAQPNANAPTLRQIEMIVPNNETQRKFRHLVIKLKDSQQILLNQNRLLKEARDILLPRLMSGMIDVEQLENIKG